MRVEEKLLNPGSSIHSAALAELNRRDAWKGDNQVWIDGPIQIMEALGNPQDKIKSIHVAGTNGKGTVCSLLSAMLIASGARVTQFVSPHLTHYTERLLLQGVPVEENTFLEAMTTVFEAEKNAKLKLTQFELIVATSFIVSADKNIDWMIVEAGLGGRLDATNVLSRPNACVITSIGLDHTHLLGNTLELIATEKAGIVKPASPLFVGIVPDGARKVILEKCKELASPVYFLEKSDVSDSPENKTPFYRQSNIELAKKVASSIGLSKKDIEKGVETFAWPGRLEKINLRHKDNDKHFLLDGAHNPDGVIGLIDYLSRSDASEFLILVSVLVNKDITAMMSSLLAWSNSDGRKVKFISAPISNHESNDPLNILKLLGGGIKFSSIKESLEFMKDGLEEGALGVVTGSLYLIGEARPLLTNEPIKALKQTAS